MKKLFGEINMNWVRVIVMAIVIGVYTGIVAMIPELKDTSFTDLTVTFEVWILFGVLIIMNSKSAKDSALKCFVFFLISQPLIYLVQDFVNHTQLFQTYYRFWVLWTVACLPMGFFGYYMKKDKWWGLLILTPILIFLGEHYGSFLGMTIFSFPRHLLTTIFCFGTLIIYPLFIFKEKKNRIAGAIISALIIIGFTIYALVKPVIYNTDLFSNTEEHPFDENSKVYLVDKKYGELSVVYNQQMEDYLLHAEFKKAGKTQFVIESKDGTKQTYDIIIKRDSFDIEKAN